MKGDFTRWTFRPAANYSSVLLQQGRVLLDADWNEQRAIDLTARRRLAADLIGPAAGPMGHVGFGLTPTDADSDGIHEGLRLAAGRYYVDGILCELGVDTPISAQPDLPGVDPLAGLSEGRYLVYLDVWERHVTHIEDARIKEKALGGPDHTTRAQVVAQARLLSLDELALGAGECDAIHDPSALGALIEGTRGRAAASVDPTPAATDPCVVPASAGYRGLENQLYRVEIHKGGNDGTVTFKWSRDNGSVVTAWTGQQPSSGTSAVLEVGDLGPDSERTFNTHNLLVELLDDSHQLLPGPGILAHVDSADEAAPTLTVMAPMDPDGAALPLSAIAFDPLAPHPRVRRWDGGSLRRIDEVDVTDGGFDWIELEKGVRVRFEFGAGQTFRSGDYWLIPARTVDGTIDWEPDGAQDPHGKTHRYACIAIVTLDAAGDWAIEDPCQVEFPTMGSLTQLRYVGGDGQQAVLSDPATTLPASLRVQVLNGGAPVVGAQIRFHINSTAADDGILEDLVGGASGQDIVAVTAPNGGARVRWTVASESAWDSDPDLVNLQVRAILLDECGDETQQVVRYDTSHSPPMAALDAAGFPSDDVQGAVDVLTANPSFTYVSGDGQEAMPGNDLPNELAVRVGNGAFPHQGATVAFLLVDLDGKTAANDVNWAGSLVVGTVGTETSALLWGFGPLKREISVQTDAEGYASVRWTVGATPGTQRPGVRARLVLPGAPIPFDIFSPGAQIFFQGRWSLASNVSYTPACEHLAEAGVDTVQEALDALCTDRTLYYVSGTGQAAELGETLLVPLTVRVANEGVPIGGARVRFQIQGLDHTLGIDESTGGTLDSGGPGVVGSDNWTNAISSGTHQVIVESDGDGLARATWVYPADEWDGVPGVRATLLDDAVDPTTSIVEFGAVLQRAQLESDDGVHVVETTMVDRFGTVRDLRNDSVVDPNHLLAQIRIRCDVAVNPAILKGKRTAHLRLEVPYGWQLGGEVPDETDDFFRPSGVQHYDEHILAGTLASDDTEIIWTPTTAARRMLVKTTTGPMGTGNNGYRVLPQDWPLPRRLAIFGARQTRVRAVLTVEGDFITAQGDDSLHLDGETRGVSGSGGLIDLLLPSQGDGRAGGDFRTWFWLDLRQWWRPTDVGTFAVPIDTASPAVVVVEVEPWLEPSIVLAWTGESRVHMTTLAPGAATWSFGGEAVGTDVPSQTPAFWVGDVEDGVPQVNLAWTDEAGDAWIARASATGTTDVVRLVDIAGSSLPKASTPPSAVGLDSGSALAWADSNGQLVLVSGDAAGHWSVSDLNAAVAGSTTRGITDAVFAERSALRAVPSASLATEASASAAGGGGADPTGVGAPGPSRVFADFVLGMGASAGLDKVAQERLVLSAGRVAVDPGSEPQRADVEALVGGFTRKGRLQFRGRPVVMFADGSLLVLAQGTRGKRRALYCFERDGRSGTWSGEELSARLEGWQASPSDALFGSAAVDAEGEGRFAAAWWTSNDSVLALLRRGDSAWALEVVPIPSAVDTKRPPVVVVDGVGLTHVFLATAATDGAKVVDVWSDGAGHWTQTDLAEQGGLSGLSATTAAVGRSGEAVVVVSTELTHTRMAASIAELSLPFRTDERKTHKR
jgi:Family of unknown function (DUF6519)